MSSNPTKQYRNVGDRAMILESGAPLGPGEFIDLADDQITGVNEVGINEGRLVEVPQPETKKKTAAKEGSE